MRRASSTAAVAWSFWWRLVRKTPQGGAFRHPVGGGRLLELADDGAETCEESASACRPWRILASHGSDLDEHRCYQLTTTAEPNFEVRCGTSPLLAAIVSTPFVVNPHPPLGSDLYCKDTTCPSHVLKSPEGGPSWYVRGGDGAQDVDFIEVFRDSFEAGCVQC